MKKIEKWMKVTPNKVLGLFVSVPFIFSIVSTIHLIVFATLGNLPYLATIFAITVELGALVTFIALSPNILKALNKGMVLSMFVLLFGLQAIGNVYAIFDYIMGKIEVDGSWLESFDKMTMETMDPYMQIMVIAIILGLFVPVLSLMLLKSAIDYLGKSANSEIEGVSEGVSEGVNNNIPLPDAPPMVEDAVSDAASDVVSDAVNDAVNDDVEPILLPTVEQVVKPPVEENAANTEKKIIEKEIIPEINKKKENVVIQDQSISVNDDDFYKKNPEEKI